MNFIIDDNKDKTIESCIFSVLVLSFLITLSSSFCFITLFLKFCEEFDDTYLYVINIVFLFINSVIGLSIFGLLIYIYFKSRTEYKEVLGIIDISRYNINIKYYMFYIKYCHIQQRKSSSKRKSR